MTAPRPLRLAAALLIVAATGAALLTPADDASAAATPPAASTTTAPEPGTVTGTATETGTTTGTEVATETETAAATPTGTTTGTPTDTATPTSPSSEPPAGRAPASCGSGTSTPPAATATPTLPPPASLPRSLRDEAFVVTESTRAFRWTDPDQPQRHPCDLPGGPDRAWETYEDLELRVSQTRDLRSQAIQVEWRNTQGTQVPANAAMQLMQCWSDAPDVQPRREQCAYGGNPFTAGNAQGPSGRGWAAGSLQGTQDRETEYRRVSSLSLVTAAGEATRNGQGGPARSTWTATDPLVFGWAQPCPATATRHRVVVETPPGAQVPGGAFPPEIELVAALPLPAPSLDVALPDPFGRTETIPQVTPAIRLSDFEGAANVEDAQWPVGRYTVRVECLTASGGVGARYATVVYSARDVDRPFWRLPRGDSDQTVEAVVPFDPIGTFNPPTSDLNPVAVYQYLAPGVSNEVTGRNTSPTGVGRVTMEMQTNLDQTALGCGRVDDGVVRSRCWLVAVPRWASEDGTGSGVPGRPLDLATGGVTNAGGPLGRVAWDRRIVVPLDFASVASACGSSAPLSVNTNDVARAALLSWQPAVCTASGAAVSVSVPRNDFRVREQFNLRDTMAVTGEPPPAWSESPTAVVAPLATTALTLSFLVDRYTANSGDALLEQFNFTQVNDLVISPRLMAKLLTQSYDSAARPNGGRERGWNGAVDRYNADAANSFSPARSFPASNPVNLYSDPEFLALNPEFAVWAQRNTAEFENDMALPLVSGNTTDAYRTLWAWVLADERARAFLRGEPDEWGGRINPYWQDRVTPDLAGFPLFDLTCGDVVNGGSAEIRAQWEGFPLLCTGNTSPRATDDFDVARSVLRGNTQQRDNDGRAGGSDPPLGGGAANPAQFTWRLRPAQARTLGEGFRIMGVTSSSWAARFVLPTARLGTTNDGAVGVSSASLTAGRDGMLRRADGVLVPDPQGLGGAGGYPLTVMAYGAVNLCTTSTAAREAFAAVFEHAAGPGQVPGSAPGTLPPGYVPLTASLRRQAAAAATILRDPGERLASCPQPRAAPAPASSPRPSAPRPPASGPPAPAAVPTPPRPAAAAGAPASRTAGPGPAAAPLPSEEAEPEAGADVTAGTARASTADADSRLRWVIPLVLGAGLAGAVGGPLVALAGRRRARDG